MNQPIGLRPLLFGSRGDSSFFGGTVDIGATSASSFCSSMHCISSVCSAKRVCMRADVSSVVARSACSRAARRFGKLGSL